MTTPVTPCIWLDGNAEEAANFYVSVFADSHIDQISRFQTDAPFPPHYPAGTALIATFTLGGRPFATMNAGSAFRPTEAISFVLPVADQAELDRYWSALTADGGAESMCGWCKDRFGVSWQIVPANLVAMQVAGTPEQNARMWTALMTMGKIDIATLEAAYAGEPQP
jgi:predicted 3-demethylubiquinone-9 3-methyltransferase (glyoxalase superfamily)